MPIDSIYGKRTVHRYSRSHIILIFTLIVCTGSRLIREQIKLKMYIYIIKAAQCTVTVLATAIGILHTGAVHITVDTRDMGIPTNIFV